MRNKLMEVIEVSGSFAGSKFKVSLKNSDETLDPFETATTNFLST